MEKLWKKKIQTLYMKSRKIKVEIKLYCNVVTHYIIVAFWSFCSTKKQLLNQK